MESVYRKRPDFKRLFDAILTSEDFQQSKPHPDCYLTAARRLGVVPDECVVFEDSVNGLHSGLDAKMKVVGLLTTNPLERVAEWSDMQTADYRSTRYETLMQLL